ncbi:hypothetical protein GLAREA_02175 [Glarea lozoyensis ATCC 20868]|uniref:Uncharacterized protein n=1 Tax=Glarea lozoyensis (strain ATCC 20868 / MF5171) TaxID=1116229 RepID=S3DI76_GLAL2|nr:uncharacterized protein GLAREA_02175 [Glarea lozoyensis ATCC 20868]EPE26263.1 hypothetical protein GLAREA_02175 [Glarea lozoyensis ATCC 20868]
MPTQSNTSQPEVSNLEEPQTGVMGNASVVTAPPPAYLTPTPFASVSFHGSHRLRLLNFPESDITAFKHTILPTWHGSIQQVKEDADSTELELDKDVWTRLLHDDIQARELIRVILQHLYNRGWILQANTNISLASRDIDTLIFRKAPVVPPVAEWITITFPTSDRLRFGGLSQQLLTDFRQILQSKQLLLKEYCVGNARWDFQIRDIYGIPRNQKLELCE